MGDFPIACVIPDKLRLLGIAILECIFSDISEAGRKRDFVKLGAAVEGVRLYTFYALGKNDLLKRNVFRECFRINCFEG